MSFRFRIGTVGSLHPLPMSLHLQRQLEDIVFPDLETLEEPQDELAVKRHQKQVRDAITENAQWVHPKTMGSLDQASSDNEYEGMAAILKNLLDPNKIARLDREEEQQVVSWIRKCGMEFRFAHKAGSFRQMYTSAYHSWRAVADSENNQAWLDRLAFEVERRIWMMNPDSESVVYYSERSNQVLVWSKKNLEQLYTNGFALAKHSAYSREASESKTMPPPNAA